MTHLELQRVSALCIEGDSRCTNLEAVAEETPIALLYNGRSHAVMMATPQDLDDFAYGFSLSEGIVGAAAELEIVDRLHTAAGISLEMLVPQRRYAALADEARNLTGRTGCGLCGAATLQAAIRPIVAVKDDSDARPYALAAVRAAFAELEAGQPLNRATGAVHAAAVLDRGGRLHRREDIGRHNAVDKALGAAFRAGRSPRALFVTSRASYEVVHKAAQCGCTLVAAISAPTALAIRLADEAGVTLAGFVRGARMTVYTHAARIAG